MNGDAEGGGLLPPAVSADRYDRDYFLHGCMGADAWRESHGARIDGLYPGMLGLAGMRPGDRVLDVGTGRGELLRAAIEAGAAEAVGVDYSPAAIELANETIAASGLQDRVRGVVADAREMPVPDRHFDLVTMLDVVEHLSHGELREALIETRAKLRPGGRIFIHTMPSPLIYQVTYRLQRVLVPWRLRTWPADPRNDFEHAMHVNEQRIGTLRGALRQAGFRDVRAWPGKWIYTDFVEQERSKRLYHRLARLPALRRFGIADLFGSGISPDGASAAAPTGVSAGSHARV
jgi:ubiquinone/menaquinone biosynthesis C-methylase UbiE